MTPRLKISIENLYETFSKYPANSNMQGSLNYDELEKWNQQLISKKLRALTDEDLSRFCGKVITTWGDENDFRHFLPRILELTAGLKTPYDIWILYSRFEDANWTTWDIKEQMAINEYTLALWENLLNDNSERAEWEFKDYFSAIAHFYPNFRDILQLWTDNNSYSAIKHLINYVFDERQNIFDFGYIKSNEKSTKNIQELQIWLTSEVVINKVTAAFYTYEQEPIAEKISWIEKILNDERNTAHNSSNFKK